ncbi:hypothetical protein BCY86_07590 [Pajaroellobacter abortibovis]|uniref:Uncharacterized protein n=1 Tax=Pajaroellobacter abortibovis TaxID=1882918 RepID=A0A1L6MYC9_9BACT|nr:hypothetical protein BCY86_07590 [Pajaroellobacter abortibovis]
MSQGWIFPHFSTDFPSTQFRHHDVKHNNEVRQMLLSKFPRLLTIRSFKNQELRFEKRARWRATSSRMVGLPSTIKIIPFFEEETIECIFMRLNQLGQVDEYTLTLYLKTSIL